MMRRALTRLVAPSFRGLATQALKYGNADIDFSKLTVKRSVNLKSKLPKEELAFGATMSDHMLEVDWKEGEGWTAPRITPYGPFQMDPAASVLHYGLECFEGMKAYLDSNDKIRLFRPEMNVARQQRSMQRMIMPKFNESEWLECLKELVRVDKDWIPKGINYSLYLRPTTISTYPCLGVSASQEIKMFCILSPVGPYYPSGFKPVKLLADERFVRAFPGGTGGHKLGSNYCGTIMPQKMAAGKGFAQILWLFGDQYFVTEAGTMNQFFLWENKGGQKELITAPLSDDTILPGVTRDSVLHLCRNMWKDEFLVTERRYSIYEVIDAIKEGRMIEGFGAGTAAIVSPVNGFRFKGTDYDVPLDPTDPTKQTGKLTARLAEAIMGIQYGTAPDPYNWSVVID